MFSNRENTIVFWKNRNTGKSGSGTKLMSKADALEFAIFNNHTDPFCTYMPVTLTDEQLKLITEGQSKTIKKNISLEQFNPFSPQAIKYKQDIESFRIQKEIFAFGLFLGDSKETRGQKNESALKSGLAQNTLFHSTVIKQELFSFLEPVDPFKPKNTPSTINTPVSFSMLRRTLTIQALHQPNEKAKIAQNLIGYSKTNKNISLEAYRALVKKAAEEKVINRKIADSKKTALYVALGAKQFERAKILLEEGADPNIPTIDGDTALKLANRMATKFPVPEELKEILNLLAQAKTLADGSTFKAASIASKDPQS